MLAGPNASNVARRSPVKRNPQGTVAAVIVIDIVGEAGRDPEAAHHEVTAPDLGTAGGDGPTDGEGEDRKSVV